VILGFRDKRTRDFAAGKRVPAFEGIRRQAEMRLDRLEAAPDLAALRGFPGNRLEALRGDRRGRYSIRVNDQWRICFRWPGGAPGPSDVEIVDYHD
jgi:proteic killer suppression protein